MKTHHPTALIADDEPFMREALREQLQMLWPDLEIVAEAADGPEALRALIAHKPSFAFLDIRMPGLTGLQVAQLVEGHTRVVFVTAYDNHALEAFEANAVEGKRSFLQSAEQQWRMAEDAFLMSNAQAVASREAPLIDVGQVATAAIGGVATQIGINSIGGADLGQVMTSSALQGIVGGVGGQPSAVYVPRPHGGGDIGAAAVASVASGVGTSVGAGLGGFVGGLLNGGKASGPAGTKPFKDAKAVDPRDFFGAHPKDTVAKDLYRNAGHYGWKRIETVPGAQAFAPITGRGIARGAVFNHDEATGAVTAAFRILSLQPIDFGSVVVAMNEHLGQPARFASADTIMRAVWEEGHFVINDGSRITVGWSAAVPPIYAKAVSAVPPTAATSQSAAPSPAPTAN